MTYNFYEVESKEDIKDLSINTIMKSLIYHSALDPDEALLLAYFTNNDEKPKISELRESYLKESEGIIDIYIIPDYIKVELMSILFYNRISSFYKNKKLNY